MRFAVDRDGKQIAAEVAEGSPDGGGRPAQDEDGVAPSEEERGELAEGFAEVNIFAAGFWKAGGEFGGDHALHEGHAAAQQPGQHDDPR